MVPLSVIMDFLVHLAVSFAIAFFLMTLVMVWTVHAFTARTVAAVMASCVMSVGHGRHAKASG